MSNFRAISVSGKASPDIFAVTTRAKWLRDGIKHRGKVGGPASDVQPEYFGTGLLDSKSDIFV